jgi:dTDP-glucose pyrophosphorylase
MILPNAIFDAINETQLSERGQKELTESIAILSKKGFRFGYVASEKFWIDPRNKDDLDEIEKFYKSFEINKNR